MCQLVMVVVLVVAFLVVAAATVVLLVLLAGFRFAGSKPCRLHHCKRAVQGDGEAGLQRLPRRLLALGPLAAV